MRRLGVVAALVVAGCAAPGRGGLSLPPVGTTPAAAPPRATAPAPSRARVKWVAIPGGIFSMGRVSTGANEWPPRKLTLKSFSLSRSEVTVGQYRACVEGRGCSAPHWDDGSCHVEHGGDWVKGTAPMNLRNPRQPVVCVTWRQARAFCRWAGGRLPTEAEWEFAARGGDGRKFPWGDQPATCARAVMGHERKCTGTDPCGCGKQRTWLVCSKPRGHSKHGLCDMAGNVWEWVEDCSHKNYVSAPRTAAPGSRAATTTTAA